MRELPCSPQCQKWFLLTGIHVPRLLTVHEHGTMWLFYALLCEPWMWNMQLLWKPKSKLCKKAVLTYLGIRWSKRENLSDLGRTGATPTLLRLMFCTENILEFLYVVLHVLLTAITMQCLAWLLVHNCQDLQNQIITFIQWYHPASNLVRQNEAWLLQIMLCFFLFVNTAPCFLCMLSPHNFIVEYVHRKLRSETILLVTVRLQCLCSLLRTHSYVALILACQNQWSWAQAWLVHDNHAKSCGKTRNHCT